MSAVTIYTTESCVFCLRAKEYLRSKGVAYEEVDVTGDAGARARLVERANGCLLYTSPSPRDRTRSRMPSSA